MYHLTTLLVAILTSVSAPCVLGQIAQSTTLTFNTKYDDGSLPISQMSCLGNTKGNLAQLIDFPFIGGAQGVGPDACGLCYAVMYDNITVTFSAVDHVDAGFVVSKTVMEILTRGNTDVTGPIDVTYGELSLSPCKM